MDEIDDKKKKKYLKRFSNTRDVIRIIMIIIISFAFTTTGLTIYHIYNGDIDLKEYLLNNNESVNDSNQSLAENQIILCYNPNGWDLYSVDNITYAMPKNSILLMYYLEPGSRSELEELFLGYYRFYFVMYNDTSELISRYTYMAFNEETNEIEFTNQTTFIGYFPDYQFKVDDWKLSVINNNVKT